MKCCVMRKDRRMCSLVTAFVDTQQIQCNIFCVKRQKCFVSLRMWYSFKFSLFQVCWVASNIDTVNIKERSDCDQFYVKNVISYFIIIMNICYVMLCYETFLLWDLLCTFRLETNLLNIFYSRGSFIHSYF